MESVELGFRHLVQMLRPRRKRRVPSSYESQRHQIHKVQAFELAADCFFCLRLASKRITYRGTGDAVLEVCFERPLNFEGRQDVCHSVVSFMYFFFFFFSLFKRRLLLSTSLLLLLFIPPLCAQTFRVEA